MGAPEPTDVEFTVVHDPQARRVLSGATAPVDAEFRVVGEPRWAPLGRWWRETWPKYRDPKYALMLFVAALVVFALFEQIRLLLRPH